MPSNKGADEGLSAYLDRIEEGGALLTAEQEHDLAERVRQKDPQALDQLITSNLRLVVSIATRYVGRGISFSDLISEGYDELMEVAEDYDASRSRFATYVGVWIEGRMRRAIHGYWRRQGVESVSLDDVDGLNIARDRKLEEIMPVIEAALQRLEVDNPHKVDIFRQYYFFDNNGERLTHKQIAQKVGVSDERVRQICGEVALDLSRDPTLQDLYHSIYST